MFKLLDIFMVANQKNPGTREKEAREIVKHQIMEFFMNIIPNAAFICVKEAWSSYYTIKQNVLEEFFLQAFKKIHGEYPIAASRNQTVSTNWIGNII